MTVDYCRCIVTVCKDGDTFNDSEFEGKCGELDKMRINCSPASLLHVFFCTFEVAVLCSTHVERFRTGCGLSSNATRIPQRLAGEVTLPRLVFCSSPLLPRLFFVYPRHVQLLLLVCVLHHRALFAGELRWPNRNLGIRSHSFTGQPEVGCSDLVITSL